MKNNILFQSILLSFLLFISLNGKTQIINNRINIYFGYKTGTFHGKKLIKESDFTYPSLFANMKELNGESMKLLINSHLFFSIGFSLDYLTASNWNYPDHSNYTGSETIQKSISPTIQFHNKFKESGILNKIKCLIEFSPTVGSLYLTLKNPLFDIQGPNYVDLLPMKNRNVFWGINGSIGLEYTISQSIGIYSNYSLGYNWIKGNLYNDKYFSSSQLVFGLLMKFEKNKRFFY